MMNVIIMPTSVKRNQVSKIFGQHWRILGIIIIDNINNNSIFCRRRLNVTMSRDDDDEEEHHSFEKWKINQKFSLDRWMDR